MAPAVDADCERPAVHCPATYRALADNFSSKTVSPWCEHRKCLTTGHNGIFATTSFAAGDVLCKFGHSAIYEQPTYQTLQVGASKHILLSPEWLENTNHSCDPNVFFNTEASALLALRAIAPGDELCFFYPSTEWAMGEPFACRCGAATCLGHVAGASALTPQQLEGRRLTPYIQQRLAEAAAAKAATAEAAKAAEAAAPGGGGSG